MSESNKETSLDFLSEAPPALDSLLEEIAEGLSDGTLKTYSNANERAFMAGMVENLERTVASRLVNPSP